VSSRDPASPIYNINSTAGSNRVFFIHVPQTTLGQLRFGDQTAIVTGCPITSFPGYVGGEKAFPTPTQPGNEAGCPEEQLPYAPVAETLNVIELCFIWNQCGAKSTWRTPISFPVPPPPPVHDHRHITW